MKKKLGKVRFAVVGLGHIAQVAVLPAFRHARKNSELTAFVTGSRRKAKLLSRKYDVGNIYSYEQYSELLQSGEVDAVYIATPNEEHTDYACRALRTGIHVLCEKPLAITTEDCLKMIAASKESGAKLMTAYRLHFDKPTMDAIQLCRRGKLGKLKTYLSSFSYVIQDKTNIRLRPMAGSGPLWDIGIYCINAARYLFLENPIEVFGYGARMNEGPFSSVDESVSVLMRFSDDRVATFQCSFNMTESSYFEVYGNKGMLRLTNAFEYAFPPELHTFINEKRSKKKYKKVDQFAAELDYFADCIRRNKKIEPSGEEGFTDVAIILAIEQSTGEGKPIAVNYAGLVKSAEPRKEMVTQKPPVTKPELIDVKSASV
jgi:predicted dehydrogenase